MVSKARKIFFQILTVGTIASAIFSAWGERHLMGQESAAVDAVMTSLEEQTFLLQSKIYVGAMRYAGSNASAMLPAEEVERISTSFKKVYIDSSLRGITSSPEDEKKVGLGLIRKKIVMAEYTDSPDELDALRKKLTALNNESDDPTVDKLLLSGKKHLSANQVEILEEQLGWFGSVFSMSRVQDKELKEGLEAKVYDPAFKFFMKFAVGAAFGMMLGCISIVLFVGFVIQLVRRKLVFQFQKTGMPSDYSLEIFALYLVAMVAGSKLVGRLSEGSTIQTILRSNLGLIAGTLLILSWPMLFGNSFSSVRERIGLKWYSVSRTLSDIFAAPLIYVGALTLLISILILYSMFLFGAGIDISGGAHPVVPVLLGSDDNGVIKGIVILAVLFAPIVEEIMFRGALYSWLRDRVSPVGAMLISALVFASVHPQGAIGIIPLGVIGFVLAFIREWRGNLTTCMVTHACFNAGTLTLIFFFYK